MASGGIARQLALLAFLIGPTAASALDAFSFSVAGDDPALTAALRGASLLAGAEADGRTDPHDLLAAALADYARLTEALYAEGHYGGVVHIMFDNREAARVPTFAVPDTISQVQVTVAPGPQFRFSTARVAPLPIGATPPEGFTPGAPAPSTVILAAAQTGVDAWRDVGHAKADVSSQRIVADHRTSTLAADIALAPGPLVHFGDLVLLTPSAVRAERIARIAGLPSGQVFAPAELDRATERLRRTGAFASVSLIENPQLNPGDTMDIGARIVDEKPRRYGFGAEVSSLDGLTLSGYWMHRNLFGGAERLKIEAKIGSITGVLSGMDYTATARLDVPAAFGTDTDAYVEASAQMLDEPGYRLVQGKAGAGVHRIFSDRLDGELGLSTRYSIATDDLGTRRYSLISLPGALIWDRRNTPLDATEGFYAHTELEPFHDFSGGASGARVRADLRAYRGFGADDRFVIAARGLVGMVAGASATAVPPDFLFFSGGGDTVRGFAHQSLGIDLGGGDVIGGRTFLGASGELRYKATDKIGLVAFTDFGQVGQNMFFDAASDWQLGAGLGLRYDTGLGPIRLDLAVPVRSPGGGGFALTWPQVYVGLGQSF